MRTANHHLNLTPVYGISISVISIVFMAIFYFTNTSGALWTGYFVNLLVFLGVLFSIIHYNSQHHERTSLLALFSMGFRTTLWTVVIISVFNIVLHLIGRYKEGIEASNFWIFLVTNILFTNLVLGVLASVIGAMVFKRNQKTTRPD